MNPEEPEAEIGTDTIVYDPDEGPMAGLEFDTDAEEAEEIGSHERDAKAIKSWVRQVVGVQDMTKALRESKVDGVSEHLVLGGYRDTWKNEWCDLTVKPSVSGRYHFQTIPGGILELIPDGPVSTNTVTLTYEDPDTGGKERPIELEPYFEKGLTEPIQVQLLHLIKSTPAEDDPYGIDLDRVIVRTIHAPQFPAFDPSTGVGLERVCVTVTNGPSVRNLYSLVDHQAIEGEGGTRKIIDVPVDMWNGDIGENQSSSYDMKFANAALRMKLAKQYRWVAALKIADIACDGDNSNVDQWLYDGRRLIYGAQAADQQEAEAAIRIADAGHRRERYQQAARNF